jgi:hypothetical protein
VYYVLLKVGFESPSCAGMGMHDRSSFSLMVLRATLGCSIRVGRRDVVSGIDSMSVYALNE